MFLLIEPPPSPSTPQNYRNYSESPPKSLHAYVVSKIPLGNYSYRC
ncbi:unnamed protein product [Penicillium nalgiovense]|nr:unnamed protein product [Penicillium nalgiovense]